MKAMSWFSVATIAASIFAVAVESTDIHGPFRSSSARSAVAARTARTRHAEGTRRPPSRGGRRKMSMMDEPSSAANVASRDDDNEYDDLFNRSDDHPDDDGSLATSAVGRRRHRRELRGTGGSKGSAGSKDSGLETVNYPPPPSSTPVDSRGKGKKTHSDKKPTTPGDKGRNPAFLNPERGYYRQYEYNATSPANLNFDLLTRSREEQGLTLILRLYYLSEFFDRDLTEAVLDDIAEDFAIARYAGFKVILRFAYTPNLGADVTEPKQDQVLKHIDQLTPVLRANADVIAVMQTGFIGAFGEWDRSTNFPLNDREGRASVLRGLLDALPKDRIVQLRTPGWKQLIYETFDLNPTGGFVKDPSFEFDTASVWTNETNIGPAGYSIETEVVRTGSGSVRVTNGAAFQLVQLNAPTGYRITISGYSLAVNVPLNPGTQNYAVYADVNYVDENGTKSTQFGKVAAFSGGTSSDWVYSEFFFDVPEGLTAESLSLYALYRDQDSGVAYFDDLDVTVSTPPVQTGGFVLNADTAYDGSDIARTGHHNDCFLATATDLGTYPDDTKSQYPYLSQDTMFTAMGGETCGPNPPRSECPTAAEELELFHYSYMHFDFEESALQLWRDGGCFDTFGERFGYVFVLTKGLFPKKSSPAGTVPFSIRFDNRGYASPINPRRVQLVLENEETDEICAGTFADDDLDVRTWYGGQSHELAGNAVLPSNLPEGKYRLLLNIADRYANLSTRLEYKISVANGGGINELSTGLIDLHHEIKVKRGYSSSHPRSGPTIAVRCGVEGEVLPPPPPILFPNSLVRNGSFESYVPRDWNAFIDGYEVVTDQKRSGQQSVLVTNGAATQRVPLADVPAGTSITLRGYSKGVDLPGSIVQPELNYAVYADVFDSSDNYLDTWTVPFDGTSGDWEYVERSFPNPTNAAYLNLFTMYRAQDGGAALFDDFGVTLPAPLVMNGGFEGPDVHESWSAYKGGYAVTHKARTGRQGIAVSDGGAKQRVHLHGKAPEGTVVAFGGYSWADGVSQGLKEEYSIYAKVQFVDRSGIKLLAPFESFGTSSEWELQKRTFVTEKGVDYIELTAKYRKDSGDGTAYFDDLFVSVS